MKWDIRCLPNEATKVISLLKQSFTKPLLKTVVTLANSNLCRELVRTHALGKLNYVTLLFNL